MTGSLHHTYVAAIQHDLVETGDADRIGVVRRPTPWFHGAVDRNLPALGPPADFLDEFQEHKEELGMQGLCGEEAHNTAWRETDFERRYLEYIDGSGEAREAISEVVDVLREAGDAYLVCYENTSEKRCHRVPLVDRILAEM